MKVYELMNELAKMPAGNVVRIEMLKGLSELPVYEEGLREINFEVQSVEDHAGKVVLDGWAT